jgi:NADH-quinone oxidoreductase subunit N
MTSPYIWIGFPLVVAALALVFERRRTIVSITVILTTLLLTFLALVTPIGALIRIGSFSFQIPDTLLILGRQFIIPNTERSFLIFVYGFASFWFIAAGIAQTQTRFLPLGLAICALLIAAATVEPFLYSALIIEMAVLVSIPLLKRPGVPISKGVLRYLIFQTLAIPFILLAGWIIGGVEANPSDQVFLSRTIILLAMGFSFWLAVFPFYSWIPLLAEQSHPYEAGFILVLLPTITLLLGLDFLDSYAWLREYPSLLVALQLMGVIMIATGGVWAAFQINLKRLLGYGIIIETGFSLIAVSLGNHTGLELFSMLFLPRVISLAVMALALSILQKYFPELSFEQMKGGLRKYPFACVAFLTAYFSLGGFPLLAGFPTHQLIFENLSRANVAAVVWGVVGILFFLISGLRVLSTMLRGETDEWKIGERRFEIIIMASSILILFFIGLFPNLLLPQMVKLISSYSHLW